VLPEAARELIESGALGHLVTLNADGSPQVSCVWVGIDRDELVSGHLSGRQRKLRNVRRDPRVTVSFEGTRIHPPGLKEYLVVHGRARIEEGGAPELLQRLAYVHLGRDVTFPPMDDPPPGFVLRIAVERLGGIGPWTAVTAGD
jgi:PPOX class probable F420-dependent enzyme